MKSNVATLLALTMAILPWSTQVRAGIIVDTRDSTTTVAREAVGSGVTMMAGTQAYVTPLRLAEAHVFKYLVWLGEPNCDALRLIVKNAHTLERNAWDAVQTGMANVNTVRNNLAAAQNAFATASAGVSAAERDLATATAGYAAATAALAVATAATNLSAGLYAAGVAAATTALTAAELTLNNAWATLVTANQALSNADAALAAAGQALEEAHAEVDVKTKAYVEALAALAEAQVALEDCENSR